MARIVVLSTFATPFRSGAEACAEEVPQALKDRFNFTIVTARLRRDLPKRDSIGGVPVVRVGIGRPLDKWLFPILAPLAVRRLKTDIIHAVRGDTGNLRPHRQDSRPHPLRWKAGTDEGGGYAAAGFTSSSVTRQSGS